MDSLVHPSEERTPVGLDEVDRRERIQHRYVGVHAAREGDERAEALETHGIEPVKFYTMPSQACGT